MAQRSKPYEVHEAAEHRVPATAGAATIQLYKRWKDHPILPSPLFREGDILGYGLPTSADRDMLCLLACFACLLRKFPGRVAYTLSLSLSMGHMGPYGV